MQATTYIRALDIVHLDCNRALDPDRGAGRILRRFLIAPALDRVSAVQAYERVGGQRRRGWR
jgi:hypothetical protein